MNKVRAVALMEIMLKLLERVSFARIEKAVMDNSMLREEQYGKVSYQYFPSVINIFPEPHSIIDNIGYLMIIIDNIETKCTQNG